MKTIKTFKEFDAWLNLAVTGQANRHQLWLGRPGKGKSRRLHRHVRNTVGRDYFPNIQGRAAAPIYTGHMTPAKWFVRGWQHRLEGLLCLNDVAIRASDMAWEAMLCQFLEEPGARTIRWDIRTRNELSTEDRLEIYTYWEERGLTGGSPGKATAAGGADGGPPDQAAGKGGLCFAKPKAGGGHPTSKGADALKLPGSYETSSTVIVMANGLGDERWSRVLSRLNTLEWAPEVAEMIADMQTWSPAPPPAVLGVIEQAEKAGEVLDLDFRKVEDAAEACRLGMSWEEELRRSFVPPEGDRVAEDGEMILDYIKQSGACPGQVVTERDLYQAVGSLRGDKGRHRRDAALDYLDRLGWIRRVLPTAIPRPGVAGRRQGKSIEVLNLPEG